MKTANHSTSNLSQKQQLIRMWLEQGFTPSQIIEKGREIDIHIRKSEIPQSK